MGAHTLISQGKKNTYPGIFLTFEGGDGSGKSTQIERLASRLRACGYDVVLTREPGGTELGVRIRNLLLHSGEVSPRAEALLYAADRAHNIATKVSPALERGAVVLADRYLDSSVAYQGAARELGSQEVRDLSLWASEGLLPDRTILLDVPVNLGRERVGKTQDRIEAAGYEFHEAVRCEYLKLAEREPERWVRVEGVGSIDEVAARVYEAVVDLFEKNPTESEVRA